MKRYTILTTAVFSLLSLNAGAQTMNISQDGDTATLTITNPTKYLILPVEESQDEAQVQLYTGDAADTWMDVRLTHGKTDYAVPFALGGGSKAVVKIVGATSEALGEIRLSDSFDTTNTDYYRPLYHHTPAYGWMNDANGLVYKDGLWHLYFQYNPYGSKWGNMHWGHSVSKDLVTWQHRDPAIARDTLGHIFSGSTVVDKYNSAGYGKDAIIALYTSASDKNGQIQCMAYSTDDGNTYTKYEGNPVLTPFDGLADFRDPKVFRYENGKEKAWYMIVSADKELRFYKSQDLKQWQYVSAFGRGYGAQPNQFECPDFFPMTLNGKQKWVMTVNINPGCLFGGSATEYFIGDFDGTTFTCDNGPEEAKFLDWGKDHYATVTFSNAPDGRIVAVPWVSNWQYANVTPIQQYRGQNGLSRELKLFEKDGNCFLSAAPVAELAALRKSEQKLGALQLSDSPRICPIGEGNGMEAFELKATLCPGKASMTAIELANDKGEQVLIYLKDGKVVMDRTHSGLVAFGKKAQPHDIERRFDEARPQALTWRAENAINYQNDFALATWAPLSLCDGDKYDIDIFVDKCSVELFVDGGRIAMTNLVFPTEPYSTVKFYTEGGEAEATDVRIYPLN